MTGTPDKDYPVFTPDNHRTAHQAAHAAYACASRQLQANTNDRQLQRQAAWCHAAVVRFPHGTWQGEARTRAERAYAGAMEAIARDFEDVHALAMAVEGYMNNDAWDFRDAITGAFRQPDAQRAFDLLSAALPFDDDVDNTNDGETVTGSMAPRSTNNTSAKFTSTNNNTSRTLHHPLLLHLHLHLMEAAPRSGGAWAQRSADALALHYPGAGHLLHMPSHTYLRVGRWADGVDANMHAWHTNVAAAQECRVPYLPSHNLDVLIFMASMAGRYTTAVQVARVVRKLPQGSLEDPVYNYVTLPLLWLRFADWQVIEQWPGSPLHDPEATLPVMGAEYAQALWWHAQILRQLATQPRSSWNASLLAELDCAAAGVGPDVPTKPGAGLGIWSAGWRVLTDIMVNTTRAAVAIHAQPPDWEEAVMLLQWAADAEGAMGYTEPPRLGAQPIAQCLGAALLAAGRAQEAVDVYLADLQEYPRNGWSLLGLSQAYAALGEEEDAARAMDAHVDAFRGADVQLDSSCPMLFGGGMVDMVVA